MEAPALSVLIIDQDQRSSAYLISVLAKQNYVVQVATSAKEGYIVALRDRPEVVILDPVVADLPAVELVKRLRSDKRTSTATIIALASFSDAEQMGNLLGAGCNEYLVKSQEAVDRLVRLLSGADQQVAETQPMGGSKKKGQGGTLVVFLSAKGGTGTSSLCANIAQVLASSLHPELEVAVMDLVLPLGSIGPIVGYQGDFNLVKATSQPLEEINSDTLRRLMAPLEGWNFRLLAGPPDPEAANAVDASRIPILIKAFRRAFDVTFIDLGRSLSRISLPIILEADVLVTIISPDLATATLTQTIWEFFKAKGVSQNHVYVLMNRSVGLEGLSKSDAEKIIGLSIQSTIPYLSGNFSLANNQHLPILRKMPNDTAALTIEHVSEQILEIAFHNRT